MTANYPGGTGPDLRANAFVGAWERIEAAQKLKVDRKNQLVDPLPELYWATMLEAAVLAHLANASEHPARDAGRYVADRDRRTVESRDWARKLVRQFDERGTNDVAPWATGQRVRVKHGSWAGRTGRITRVIPDGEPPRVEVALDLLHVTDTPVDISVPMTEVELESADQ